MGRPSPSSIAMRWNLWLPHRGRLNTWRQVGIVAISLVACWVISLSLGGAGHVAPHWFYGPILLAATWFGAPGALGVAAIAGLLAGPLLPADVADGTAQQVSDWLSRGMFFIAIGQLMVWVISKRKAAENALLQSETTVSELRERLNEQEMERARFAEVSDRIKSVLEAESGMSLVLQPIVDLESREVRGVEALTRFPAEPQQGPDVWFAEAAEVGMGVDLELRAAFLALGALQQLPEGIYLSINLSPEALISPRFREVLPDIPAGRLVVEITEHAPVDDYAALREPIAELRARGGRLAVDDVGAGFASLRHILKLDPDVIKLDIGLTRHVDSDPGVRAVAAALIAFASEFGASVVSEGIETEEEAQSLRELGVSVGQGYGLGRPLPIEQLFPEARGHHALPFRPGGAARGSVDEALREPIPRVGHG